MRVVKYILLYNVCRLTIDKINAHVHQYDTQLYYVEKEKLERISGKNAHQVRNLLIVPFCSWCVHTVGNCNGCWAFTIQGTSSSSIWHVSYYLCVVNYNIHTSGGMHKTDVNISKKKSKGVNIT